MRNFGIKMVKMGQIFIQNGPSEVVGLTQPVLVLTNLSPHHIFRSRTCSRFLISYVIIFIIYEFQIIPLCLIPRKFTFGPISWEPSVIFLKKKR